MAPLYGWRVGEGLTQGIGTDGQGWRQGQGWDGEGEGDRHGAREESETRDWGASPLPCLWRTYVS